MEQPPTEVVELAANLDDAPGELIGAAAATLLEEGALDVWTTPITMKKGRPGVMVSLLCEVGVRERMAKRLIELTGTFGVRHRTWQRTVLERRHQTVRTDYGAVRVKIGSLNGEDLVVKPEFDDAEMAAKRHGVTVMRVMDAARAAAAGMDRSERDA